MIDPDFNDMEIMQFSIDGELYGIELGLVKEIMMAEKVKPMPDSHGIVEGVFKPRDIIYTVIDLPYFLTKIKSVHDDKHLFIILNSEEQDIAVRVHSVLGIQRLKSNEVRKPDQELYNEKKGVATGIVESENQLLVILDLKKMIRDLSEEVQGE